MRRVLAEVPCTFPYTLVAGVWRLIQQIDTDKSELNITLLSRMVPSYQESCEGRFEYLMPTLLTDSDPEKSYWIGYNGITNMISPFWRLAEEGFSKHNARIFRALYTFEAFQVMRRLNKQKDPKFHIEQLDRLLGVDFANRGTPLPEMFSRPKPSHKQTVVVNRECLAELCQTISHTKYATIIPSLFSAIRENSPMGAVRALPQISDETIAKALDLDYPLEEFMMYNIVEGFLFQSKQLRVDKENSKSLRPDLGNRLEGQTMCQEYLNSRYSEDYDTRLKHMAGEERKRILDDLIKELLETNSMATFCRLLSEGIERGQVSLKIANFNSYGCNELHDALMDIAKPAVKRGGKIAVFYTGEDSEQIAVWNGGNMYRTATGPVQKLLTDMGDEATWSLIQERYKCKRSHVYRCYTCGPDAHSCNRHGHSNDKASFFAFGHSSLVSYFSVMSEEARADYLREHPRCCALPAERDPAGLRIAIEGLAAKRARRQACETDPDKLRAAIRKTMAQRKERRALPRQSRENLKAYTYAPPHSRDSSDDASDSDS
jgi:hypothetical protein